MAVKQRVLLKHIEALERQNSDLREQVAFLHGQKEGITEKDRFFHSRFIECGDISEVNAITEQWEKDGWQVAKIEPMRDSFFQSFIVELTKEKKGKGRLNGLEKLSR